MLCNVRSGLVSAPPFALIANKIEPKRAKISQKYTDNTNKQHRTRRHN